MSRGLSVGPVMPLLRLSPQRKVKARRPGRSACILALNPITSSASKSCQRAVCLPSFRQLARHGGALPRALQRFADSNRGPAANNIEYENPAEYRSLRRDTLPRLGPPSARSRPSLSRAIAQSYVNHGGLPSYGGKPAMAESFVCARLIPVDAYRNWSRNEHERNGVFG
jgi:hypothetical protein